MNTEKQKFNLPSMHLAIIFVRSQYAPSRKLWLQFFFQVELHQQTLLISDGRFLGALE